MLNVHTYKSNDRLINLYGFFLQSLYPYIKDQSDPDTEA